MRAGRLTKAVLEIAVKPVEPLQIESVARQFGKILSLFDPSVQPIMNVGGGLSQEQVSRP
jgi:hypothetical protein